MNESLKEQVIDMSEGNPGCINVLMQTYKLVGDYRFGRIADSLQAKGVTGSLVWCEFKDNHGQDIEAFVASVESDLIETVTDRRGLVAAQKAKGS
jgi:hypothetical protein